MTARFVQIHTLTSYPATLLNRDEAGFAKRIPFGGSVRTRISSQCLKRHWRLFDGEKGFKGIDVSESVRSRISFHKFIVEPLVKEGVNESVARAAAEKIKGKLLGSEAKQEKAEKQAKKKIKTNDAEAAAGTQASASSPVSSKPVQTEQVTVLGRPELDYLCGIAREVCAASGGEATKVVKLLDEKMKNEKELKKNIAALMPGSLEAGLGAALFGRMVTGDILSRTDAAIHVAHAITVHEQLAESDYFSAMDDLTHDEGEAGSGHINASELTSGLFYGYVVVDVEGLVRNLGDDRRLATDVVKNLVHMIATVSPGAKKGSTAPYANSHLIFIEAGKAQPRTLANAFLDPVPLRDGADSHLVRTTYQQLAGFIRESDRVYGAEPRIHAGLMTDLIFGEMSKSLAEVADWAGQRVIE